ncbi:MAG: serine/threonine protein kinase [Myxococcales bacterium]|nr:serine/threonine protein kinase [Myxococcales bacterium]
MEQKPPRAGETLGGKYEIEGTLDEGGMGVVLAAVHALTGKRLAVKWLRPVGDDPETTRQRMIREARAAARIDHPNIVSVHDVAEHDDGVYLVMEYLHGEPLADRLRLGALSIEATIVLLMPVLRGVAAAHRNGVVHRDLKPGNIFLCCGPDGSPREAKLLDFGLSKVVDPNADIQSLSGSGHLLGTPSYMSPEQIATPTQIDERTDIYALGVILYECLSGRPPFEGEVASQLFMDIVRGQHQPLHERVPHIPRELSDVVARAMANYPDNRYANIEALAQALERFAPGTRFDVDPTAGHSLPVLRRSSKPDHELSDTLDVPLAPGSTASHARPRVSAESKALLYTLAASVLFGALALAAWLGAG